MKNRMLKLPRSCGVDASLALPVLLGSAGNIGCVVGVVLMNKYMQLAHDFDHLVFLSFCHFAFTAVGTRAMLCCRVFRYKAARPAAVAPVALGTLSSVGFMNLNLKHNSVSFYQLSKIACIGAAKESEIPNFKGSFLGRFPLVSADFWTIDDLSKRSQSVDAFSGTRTRGTLTLKRRCITLVLPRRASRSRSSCRGSSRARSSRRRWC